MSRHRSFTRTTALLSLALSLVACGGAESGSDDETFEPDDDETVEPGDDIAHSGRSRGETSGAAPPLASAAAPANPLIGVRPKAWQAPYLPGIAEHPPASICANCHAD